MLIIPWWGDNQKVEKERSECQHPPQGLTPYYLLSFLWAISL